MNARGHDFALGGWLLRYVTVPALLLAVLSTPAHAEVYLTVDAGQTWTERGPKDYIVTRIYPYAGEGGAAWAIAMPTAATVPEGTDLRFVSPVLLQTVDGGRTWEKNATYAGKDALCMAIDPKNAEIVWVGAWFGHLHRSADGGKSWKKLELGEHVAGEESLRQGGHRNVGFLFVKEDVVLAIIGDSLLRSTNGGKEWKQVWKRPCVEGLEYDGKILVVTGRFGIHATADAGGTWKQIDPPCGYYGGNGAISVAPDGSELIWTYGGVLMSCRPGTDWQDLKFPKDEHGAISFAWCGGSVIALLQEGEYVEPDHTLVFGSRSEVTLWRRESDGAWTPLASPEIRNPIRLSHASDGSSVWLMTK